MTDLFPIILARTGGTPGAPDATGLLRRLELAELATYGANLLDWLSPESVLVRAAGVPISLVLPPSSVVGRGASGSVRALTASDLDSLLGLSALIGGRDPAIHGHAVGEITNLQNIIANLARLVHTHEVTDLLANGVPTGYVVTKGAGGVAWAAPTGGGGATLAGPLVGDIEMGTFKIYGCSPSVEFFRCSGGRLIVQGGRLPILNENTPTAEDVWIWTGSAWTHQKLTANNIDADPLTGVPGTTVHAQLAELLALIEARALLSHSHALSDIEVPGGATTGQVVTVAAGGGFVVTTPSGGGGGVANPLIANLNIATYALVSGATEILKYAGGQVILGGRAVFPAEIVDPETGHVAIYNGGTELFENGFMQAELIEMTAIPGLASTSVQAALADLKGQLNTATLETTDDLDEGALNKYATAASVEAAGAVMVSAISDDETLADEAVDETVSERAIKAYVDAEIAGVGGGGIPLGTSFPGAPDDGDLLLRTDLRETFIYRAASTAWISLDEKTVCFALDLSPAQSAGTAGAGAYIFGTGNTFGYRLPFNAYISGATVQTDQADTGTVEIRRAPFGGSVSLAIELLLSGAAGVSATEQLVSANAGDILSAHAENFVEPVNSASITISYRRRFAA
jgi:hypothetical protein